MLQLFKHQLREQMRSALWQKSLVINIFLAILAVYFCLNFIAIGLFADKYILEFYPKGDVVEVFTRMLFYYFTLDLIFRFLFQPIPKLAIQPYLTLPIKKAKLLRYPILKSSFSFFNIMALLMFLPFYFKTVLSANSPGFSFIWIVTVLVLVATNNYLNFSLKKYFSKKPLLIFLFLLLIVVLLYLDYLKVLSLSDYFLYAFYFVCNSPILVVIPLAIMLLSYFGAYLMLKKNAYIEDVGVNKSRATNSFSFLDKYGEIGQLLRLEIKLIFRNKRPKSLFYTSCFFLLYGFMFYANDTWEGSFMYSLCAIFLTSNLALFHGQYMYMWDSSFFDVYLANNVSTYNYIKAKYLLLSIGCVICFVLTLPYIFFDYQIAYLHLAFVLYNVGVSTVLMLYIGTYNKSFIDLGKGQFMNYEGTGAAQFLLMLPIMGFPFVIYQFLKLIDLLDFYYLIIGAIGVLAIVFHNQLLQLVLNQFEKRKSIMAVEFRKK
ncbi:DUF5687 family protein [Carboxylicivirga sp. N1Y90]|uniref:DUF5687 family protein n=1 Tax=Carboxylicivirga fragile TaxID=3417571 RepID=UPI003D32DD5E|nr:hypothetical protein [Marinilabiliaceae bacterium N1Y90]